MAITNHHSEAHICQCLTRLATAKRDSVVTVNGERSKTGMQFVESVLDLARGLVDLGLKPGDVVSISALNSDLYLEWILAIAYVGGIVAPLNYRWSLEEAKYAMEVAKPVMLVVDSSQGFWHSKFTIDGDAVPSSLRWHVLMDLPVKVNHSDAVLAAELLKRPEKRSMSLDYCWAPEKAAIICFTSGTTGKPKGAVISHSAIVVQSLAKIAIVGYNDDDVYLHTAPLCHIGGISSAMAVLMAGGCHVVMPKFDANSACEAIRTHRVTSLITVPTMMADLISVNRTKQKSSAFDSVTRILNGGGGLSPELMFDAIKTFPRATLLSAYGMTEACSSIAFMTLYDPANKEHARRSNLSSQGGVCVGKPAPHVELRIIPEEDSGAGKILMRGPHTMLGYWGQSMAQHLREGWLDTGDLGQIDGQGNLWLVGREKDRIKSGGENVYPEEVETVISKHPGISKIVVVGVPDIRLTEMVVGCVQLNDGWQWDNKLRPNQSPEKARILSTEILRHFCKERNVTGFKIPRKFVVWRNEFPTTTTGKIRRDKIRAEVVSSSSQAQFMPSKL